MAEDFKEIRVARGTDFMPVGVISTHFASSPCFQPSLCHKHNVNSIVNNKITDSKSLFLCSDRTSFEKRCVQLIRVLCVTTKMTVEKFVGSGVLLTAYNGREREVVVCPRCRLFRGKRAAVTISGKRAAVTISGKRAAVTISGKSRGTIQRIGGS